jgi:hypothetical protein
MRESMQVTMATPACATPSKPPSSKVSACLGAPEQHQRRGPGDEGADGRAREHGLLLGDAGLPQEVLERVAARRRTSADLQRRRDGTCLVVVAAQPDRGQRGDADQHPDHPGDDDAGTGEPVHAGVRGRQDSGVHGRQREAEAEAADDERDGGRPAGERGEVPAAHPREGECGE